MLFKILSATAIFSAHASFLQCSPSDSLESLEDLRDAPHAVKQGITCEKWPFYSGGFPKNHWYDHSSESEEDSSEEPLPLSLLPTASTSKDSVMYGFVDGAESHKCLAGDAFCTKWAVTKQEKRLIGECKWSSELQVVTEYELCMCAHTNLGAEMNQAGTEEPVGAYCSVWACQSFSSYPHDADAYSVVMDNALVSQSHGSSSDSDSSDSGESSEDSAYNGNYYRFAKNGGAVAIDASTEMKNCWCKAASLNGAYCLNWYCEALEHVSDGCHGTKFGVDNYGWFGCFHDDEAADSTHCTESYGFMMDSAQREEYRCHCADETCASTLCGLKHIEIRQNDSWCHFWLALLLWGCLCGCCGTKRCFRKTNCRGEERRVLKCRCTRMALFFIVFGGFSLFHGGLPAFMFFALFFMTSLYCAYKCENCKGCCRSKGTCAWREKWAAKCNTNKRCKGYGRTNTVSVVQLPTDQQTQDRDGENSKEESSPVVEPVKVTKTGHVRVSTVDLDEV